MIVLTKRQTLPRPRNTVEGLSKNKRVFEQAMAVRQMPGLQPQTRPRIQLVDHVHQLGQEVLLVGAGLVQCLREQPQRQSNQPRQAEVLGLLLHVRPEPPTHAVCVQRTRYGKAEVRQQPTKDRSEVFVSVRGPWSRGRNGHWRWVRF